MVNNKSTYVSPVKPIHLDLHHSRCTSSIAWSRLPIALQPVDVERHRLLNIDSFTSTPLCISNIEENINLLSPDGNYADVLEDFDDVFKPELRLSPGSSAKHGVQHYIETTGPPVFSKYRRLRPELLQVAKDAFMEMEKMGVCSKAASPWASPLHMTPKKDDTWRPCGDYRRLNLITEPDHYVMSPI